MMGETNLQKGDKLCVVHTVTGTEVRAAPHQKSPHAAAAGLRAAILNREPRGRDTFFQLLVTTGMQV